jgi:hypothetical protein
MEHTIPKHCIDIFIEKFGSYPSIIEFNPNKTKESVNKFVNKSEVIWSNEFIDGEGKKTMKEKFVLYDSTGIMIFINEELTLFILTTIDRYGVAEYSIETLKKLK